MQAQQLQWQDQGQKTARHQQQKWMLTCRRTQPGQKAARHQQPKWAQTCRLRSMARAGIMARTGLRAIWCLCRNALLQPQFQTSMRRLQT